MAIAPQFAAATVCEESSSPKMQLDGYDYLHLYVGNAYQAMHFLRTMFGFTPLAYSGLETGARDRVSYVLGQGPIRIIVTSPVDHSGPMADEIRLHGDAVKEIAFTVPNAVETFHHALLGGAYPVAEPVVKEDDSGKVTIAAVRAFGDVIHSFIQRREYGGAFLPGYQSLAAADNALSGCLLEIDHIALSFPPGELDPRVQAYKSGLGLEVGHEESITTQYSAMNSKVVQNGSGTVRFPMMEPGEGQRKSQIEEYLKYNNGPGVQHIAFSCKDIVETVQAFRNAGVEFLKTPQAYYDLLSARVGSIRQNIEVLRDLNVLVDRDEWGHLLQIFTKPISGRPTLFLELIQREGARGFGSGNIRALFDAVEREQRIRGNL
jgi:4-hydroxyphenylpyruvate dioxygenase